MKEVSALSILAILLSGAHSIAGSPIDQSFHGQTNATVRAFVLQPDGHIIISREFDAPGEANSGVVRLNRDGSIDSSFSAVTNLALSLALQGGSRVIMTGSFSSVAGSSRQGLARLNSDGSLDPGFNPDLGAIIGSPVEAVSKVLVQPDEKIIALVRYHLDGRPAFAVVRLSPDGQADPGFSPALDLRFVAINALLLQPDGRLLVGGNPIVEPSDIGASLIRLGTDGRPDNFQTGLNFSEILDLVYQPDGKILVGRAWPIPLVRLNPDGSVDRAFFIPGPWDSSGSPTVSALALQADGEIVAAGSFTAVDKIPRQGLARFQPDGSLDGAFADIRFFPTVSQMAFQPDGKLLIGGRFEGPDGVRTGLLRFDPMPAQPLAIFRVEAPPSVREHDGSLQVTVVRESSKQGTASVRLETRDGSARAGEDYQAEARELVFRNGEERQTVSIRVLADNLFEGVEDFFVDLNKPSPGVALSVPSARIEISDDNLGVEFTLSTFLVPEFQNETYLTLALSSPWNKTVTVELVVSGGNATPGQDFFVQPGLVEFRPGDQFKFIPILIVDDTQFEGTESVQFGLINPTGGGVVTGRTNALLRIEDNDNPRGPNFGPNGAIYTAVSQADNKILLAGEFTALNGINRTRIGRLNPDLSLDRSFDPGPGPDLAVTVMALQSDGKIVIGGYFKNVSGLPRKGIARLHGDGSVDASFDPGSGLGRLTGLAVPFSLVVAADGKILAGGDFSFVNGVARRGLARLNSAGDLDEAFDPRLEASAGALPSVRSIAFRPNGELLVTGIFAQAGGKTAPGFAGLTSSGAVSPDSNGSVASILALLPGEGTLQMVSESSGNILIGGNFGKFAEPWRVIRLSESGIDPAFNSAVPLMLDLRSRFAPGMGNVVLAGPDPGGSAYTVRRLNRSGVMDPAFGAATTVNSRIYAIVPEANGRTLIAGAFTAMNGVPANYLAELDADGGLIVPLKLELVPSVTPSSFNMIIPGGDNLFFVIETSTNLLQWSPVYTNLPPAGRSRYTELRVKEDRVRFYRLNPFPD